jgi:hypothetical protein
MLKRVQHLKLPSLAKPSTPVTLADLILEMKYIVAALYSNYTTFIVNDTGIEQSDAYTAPPKNSRLIIRLQKLQG